MKKLFASKELKAAVRKAMSPSQRKWLDEGEIFTIRIVRMGDTLKRWGDDEDPEMENVAILKVKGKNCQILDTNLKERAWSWDEEKAFEEGVRALDYYIEGIRRNYKIYIGGEEGKGNNKTHYYVRGYCASWCYVETWEDSYKIAKKLADTLRDPEYLPKFTVVK